MQPTCHNQINFRLGRRSSTEWGLGTEHIIGQILSWYNWHSSIWSYASRRACSPSRWGCSAPLRIIFPRGGRALFSPQSPGFCFLISISLKESATGWSVYLLLKHVICLELLVLLQNTNTEKENKEQTLETSGKQSGNGFCLGKWTHAVNRKKDYFISITMLFFLVEAESNGFQTVQRREFKLKLYITH